jgi:NDP-sugar pyrophosphorylase family protein
MSHASFQPDTYFDLADVAFADLFQGKDHVWEALRALDDYIAAQFETGKVKANYGDSPDVYVGEGTVIEKDVLIKGPAIIGKNCTIRHGAYFRLGCLIGDDCLVGHGCEIKHTVLLNNVAVPHLSFVLDSIFGNRVNFSGGAITPNLRLDREPVKVKADGQLYETGLLKFGAVIGDDSNIGVNAVLNPGTMLGKKSVVYPLISVKGVHPENSIIK